MNQHYRAGNGSDMIPRETLFGNPERATVRISHDGTRISYLAPVEGVLNVWVAPADSIHGARPVTKDTNRGIRFYFWTYNSDHIVYLQDRGGDENWHAYAVNVETGEGGDLTPYEGVQANPLPPSERFPDEIIIELNRRDPEFHDLFRVNILTGESNLIVKNDFGAAEFLVDRDLRPRLATVLTPNGDVNILSPSGSGRWQTMMTIDHRG